MCAPSMPAAPDPKATASSQTAQNISTGIANAYMGNVNQVTPWGSITYRPTGSYTLVDPNHPAITGTNTGGNGGGGGSGGGTPEDPGGPVTPPFPGDEYFYGGNPEGGGAAAAEAYTAGGTAPGIDAQIEAAKSGIYNIPTFTATTKLPKEQQQALNAQFEANRALSRTAADKAKWLRGYMGGGIDKKALPDMAPTPKAGKFKSTNMARVGNIRTEGAQPRNVDFRPTKAGPIDRTGARPFKADTTGGNAKGIRMSAPGGGRIGNTIADAGGFRRENAAGGDITRTYGTDYAQNRQRVEDALMLRMNRQIETDRAALQTRLANQGIVPGSKAYQNAMDDLERQIGDQRMNAILSAGQEQSRLAGLERDRAVFENTAQSQAYQQDAGNIDRSRAAQAQQFGQNVTAAQFANDAQQQRFGQGMERAQFGNAAQQQRFGQGVTNSQFRNAARQQQFDNQFRNAQFGNEAQQQRFGQNLASQQAYNQAQQQRYAQMMGNRAFQNEAQQQQFNQQRALAGDFNANMGTRFNQQLAATQQQNAARAQALQEQFALRNQPLNEISALMSGSQVFNPSFGVNTPGAIPTTDYAGIVNANYQNQLGAYGAQMGAWNGLMGGLGGLGSAAIMASDRRRKRDVRHIGWRGGLAIYEYRYSWDEPGTVRRGYMADEVARVRPDAVHRFGASLALDYDKLPEIA